MQKKVVVCEDDRRLEEACLEAVVFPAFPPLSCMVRIREPSGPTSNSSSSHSGTPRSQ